MRDWRATRRQEPDMLPNYARLGPVSIRLHRKHLAYWGFEAVRVGGLSLFTRDSGRRLIVASYHPRSSPTWHWSITLWREQPPKGSPRIVRPTRRQGQWHDTYRLPFGWALGVAQQDYHQRR